MVRLQFSIQLAYEVAPSGCDFIFNLQAAQTAQQQVVTEQLAISQPVLAHAHTDPATHTRFLRLKAQAGPLVVRYGATLDIQHHVAAPAQIGEVPVADLPAAVLPYLYPSRYCQSDRLHRFAVHTFGHLQQGYGRARAIRDWVQQHVQFCSNASDGSTSAVDTLVEKVGVCRDFAHLMIALCRAVNIPARFTTGIDYGADPALGPTDFHAYVEAFLGDRWYVFDPSGAAIPMGFVRFATGRDAADAAFATIFGGVVASAPVIAIQSVPNAQGQRIEPVHVSHALSTDGQEIIRKNGIQPASVLA
ncbi:MAG TPA: transglutaminase family protein [Burkholderiaceae bacterium]